MSAPVVFKSLFLFLSSSKLLEWIATNKFFNLSTATTNCRNTSSWVWRIATRKMFSPLKKPSIIWLLCCGKKSTIRRGREILLLKLERNYAVSFWHISKLPRTTCCQKHNTSPSCSKNWYSASMTPLNWTIGTTTATRGWNAQERYSNFFSRINLKHSTTTSKHNSINFY